MSAMSAIQTAMTVHNIPESESVLFITAISLEMQQNKTSLDDAIMQMVKHFEVELCGDCLIPAQWNETLNRYTCDKCGA